MKVVSYSSDDLAGENIAKVLRGEFGLRPGTDIVEVEGNLKDKSVVPFKADLCIVASRHKSESGKPTLTCHATGNFGSAELGGVAGHLQPTNSLYLRKAYLLLREKQRQYHLPYAVSLEVTHHGPTELPFQLLYVEVGSGPGQWKDMPACRAAAEVLYELYKAEPENVPSAIGFGGPHYAPNFSGILDKVALGHIMPKHAMEHATKEMVLQMAEKTIPRPEFAAIDWKGLKSEERRGILDALEKIGLPYKKTSELKA